MKTRTAKHPSLWIKILRGTGIVLVAALIVLVAIRLISGKPLGLRHWADVQVWHASSFVQALANSKEVKSYSQGEYTNVVFLHHSVGDNLLEQTDLRAMLGDAGLTVWDHDYNFYGLSDPAGDATGYNYWIPDDNTDPDGLAQLFSQTVYGLPVNGISGLMQHEVIVFKSCFTANALVDDAQVETVKGYYETVYRFIEQHPDKLFLLLTSPPLSSFEADSAMAGRAREVADWLLSSDFQRGLPNLRVFDLYGQLAENDPASPEYSTLRAAYRQDSDNHPNLAANQAVAPLLADFIAQSVQDFQAAQK